jgi:hypothetical protein
VSIPWPNTLSKPTLRDAGLVDEDGHLVKEYQTAQRVNEEEGRIEIDLLETQRVRSLGDPTD